MSFERRKSWDLGGIQVPNFERIFCSILSQYCNFKVINGRHGENKDEFYRMRVCGRRIVFKAHK